MKRKLLNVLVFMLVVTFFLTGCASGKSEARDEVNEFKNSVDKEIVLEEAEGSLDNISNSSEIDTTRKIIVTLTYDIETKDLDASVNMIESSVSKVGGYYEKSYVRGSTEEGGHGEYVLRIPSDKLDEFIAGVESFGNITSQTRSGDDVTSEYYDIEAELSSLKIQQERIMEIMKNAATIDEIIKLETELTRIRTQIENLTTRLKKYDNLIDYTTITIDISQVKNYTENEEGFGKQVVDTFKGSFAFALDVFKRLVLVLIWLLPYIIVISVIIAIVLIVDKKVRKKKTIKLQNMNVNMPLNNNTNVNTNNSENNNEYLP